MIVRKHYFLMRYLIFILALDIVFCCVSSAQDKEYQECIKNFNAEQLKLITKEKKLSSYFYLLEDYFICQAATTSNPDECYALSYVNYSTIAETCYKKYEIAVGFYGRLVKDGYIEAAYCNKIFGDYGIKTEKNCSDFCEAILTKKEKYCEDMIVGVKQTKESDFSLKFCKAIIGRKKEFCPDNNCKQIILYLRAIESNSIQMCKQISDVCLRGFCEGLISKDGTACKQYPGYRKFVNIYCTSKIERGDK